MNQHSATGRASLAASAAMLLLAALFGPELCFGQTPPESGAFPLPQPPPDVAPVLAWPVPAWEPTPLPIREPTGFEVVPLVDTLESAWQIALAVDPILDAERWESHAARDRWAAAQAERWPSLSVDNSYTVLSDQPAFQIANPAAPFSPLLVPNTQREYYALDAFAVWPIYTSGRITNSVSSAAADVHASDWGTAVAQADLKLVVAEEYLAVLRAQRNLEVASSQLVSLSEHGREVEVFCRYGRCQENELLAARVAQAHAEQERLRAQMQLDIARFSYNRRLGRMLETPVHLSEPLLLALEPDAEAATAVALEQRAERRVLSAKLQSLEYQSACLRAQGRPQFELRGGYSFQENQFAAPQGIASMGAVLSWQAFDGGKQRSLANAAQHEAEAVRRRLWDLDSQIRFEVRRACLEVQETTRRLAVMQTVVERAEENLRVTRDRFAHGVGTNTAVLEAEALRTQSYRDHLHARYDALWARLRLDRAVGQL